MKLRFIYLAICAFMITQCAKQTAPTGGPQDQTPPKLKSSLPKHKQTNFKGTEVELVFDEPIQLNNPREQIIITPSVGKDFETTFNKTRVMLKFKRPLQENTTYTINLREAVQDLTEKNPANEKIAFSTGSYIDSLRITGRVQDALTETNPKSYTVALAEASDTFNIFKHPAGWLTQTNKKGVFALENLKPGRYILYAFDDKSKNMIVDSKSEGYGFVAQPIDLEINIDSLKIRTFKADVNPLRLITSRPTFAYYNLRFSKSLTDFSIKPTDTTITVYASLEKDLSTVKLYNTFTQPDSTQIRVYATDSMNYTVDTLVYMKFNKKESTKDKFTAAIDGSNVHESNGIFTAQALFSKPILHLNTDSLYISLDSVTRLSLEITDYTWNATRTQLSIFKKVDPNMLFPKDTTSNAPKSKAKSTPGKQQTTLTARPGAFISAENDSSAALSAPIKFVTLESTAIIEAEVKTIEHFVLQLMNRTGNIVSEVKDQKKHAFENLPPDTYLLRIVVDKNNNGKWDPGNYKEKTEPEQIIYYRNPKGIKEISLKPNWTLGPLLITY